MRKTPQKMLGRSLRKRSEEKASENGTRRKTSQKTLGGKKASGYVWRKTPQKMLGPPISTSSKQSRGLGIRRESTMAKINDAMVDVGYNTMVGVPSVASHHGWPKSVISLTQHAGRLRGVQLSCTVDNSMHCKARLRYAKSTRTIWWDYHCTSL